MIIDISYISSCIVAAAVASAVTTKGRFHNVLQKTLRVEKMKISVRGKTRVNESDRAISFPIIS